MNLPDLINAVTQPHFDLVPGEVSLILGSRGLSLVREELLVPQALSMFDPVLALTCDSDLDNASFPPGVVLMSIDELTPAEVIESVELTSPRPKLVLLLAGMGEREPWTPSDFLIDVISRTGPLAMRLDCPLVYQVPMPNEIRGAGLTPWGHEGIEIFKKVCPIGLARQIVAMGPPLPNSPRSYSCQVLRPQVLHVE